MLQLVINADEVIDIEDENGGIDEDILAFISQKMQEMDINYQGDILVQCDFTVTLLGNQNEVEENDNGSQRTDF